MTRKSKKPTDMSSLFQTSSGTLAQLATKTNSLKILADIVRQTCPDLPQDVWHIANFRQNILVIEVNSSVWSQRLQFERIKINQQLSNATHGEFTQIEIKVAPYRNKRSVPKETKPVKTQFLSGKTAEQLREVASGAPESLRKKLEKLAKLADKNKPG